MSYGKIGWIGLMLVLVQPVLDLAPDMKAETGKPIPCDNGTVLDLETASAFAEIALACVGREFPNKPGHVVMNADQVLRPSELHPAFYGCFDWHSSVHGHWMLARLLACFPEIEEGSRIKEALICNLSKENILREAAYLGDEDRKSFERTYGWAWLLKLAEELDRSSDPDLIGLAENLQPLVSAVIERYIEFLPRQSYPIRRGVHSNTAFGMAFALDYARSAGEVELESMVVERSREYFLSDRGCPCEWEPDGDDFFSSCLIEADLMRRVLGRNDFGEWLTRFLPGLDKGLPANLLTPAIVSDRSDPKIVHLDGLNISRAWCMNSMASALPEGDARIAILKESACRHAGATLGHIASGRYEGEHWLASFAVYLLSPE
ncbi:MAG: DUF2891 domain-containing protein [Candidatus Krumholzibacteriota bacterium]|nr:DUF2891 domain-containing protein [Candidatus Krumholzibacteriota bacterium]